MMEFVEYVGKLESFYANVANLVMNHKESCMNTCANCNGITWSCDIARELAKVDVEWYKHYGDKSSG